jgi:hypothetical protein
MSVNDCIVTNCTVLLCCSVSEASVRIRLITQSQSLYCSLTIPLFFVPTLLYEQQCQELAQS